MFGEKYTEKREEIETKEYLNNVFDEKDGVLYWKLRPDEYYLYGRPTREWRNKVGKRAGAIKKTYKDYEIPYYVVGVNNRQFRVPRVVWIMHNGPIPKGMEVDHIDGDPLNDRIDNLRLATRSQQLLNRSTFKTNKTGYTNIRETPEGLFRVVITRQFKTLEKAIEFRDSARTLEDEIWRRPDQ